MTIIPALPLHHHFDLLLLPSVFHQVRLFVSTSTRKRLAISCHCLKASCSSFLLVWVWLNYSRPSVWQNGGIYSRWSPPAILDNRDHSEVTRTSQPEVKRKKQETRAITRSMPLLFSVTWKTIWSRMLTRCFPGRLVYQSKDTRTGSWNEDIMTTSKYPLRKDSSFLIHSVMDPLEGELRTSHSRRQSWTHMDCCPVMVSDLPVMCSRVDGVVTVVKTERPHPDWGKFPLAHRALPCPNVSRLSFKENRWHLLENCRYRSHEIYNVTQREGW